MGQFSENEQSRIIAALASATEGEPGPDVNELDPERFSRGWRRLFVRGVKAGQDPQELLADMSPSDVASIWALDADAPDPQGSTWEDLGRAIGPISWAWEGWLVDGMLTMVVAQQGQGKSCLCLRLASCYTAGNPWPDDSPFTGEIGGVLWCEAESSQGLNYQRARDWGLALPQIMSPLEDPLDDILLQDPEHLAAIEHHARQPNIRLIVIDSLSGANTSKENDAKILHIVKWLADLAKTTGKPVIVTHHLRKRSLQDAGDGVTLDRIRGSSAITQPARVIWALDTPDPQDKETRRLSVVKNNIRGLGAVPPIGMIVKGQGVRFLKDAPETPRSETLQDQVSEILMTRLRPGPMRAVDLRAELEDADITWATANKAKKKLGIVSTRRDGVWWWGLPAHEK